MNFLIDATNTKIDNFEDFRDCEIYTKTKFMKKIIKYDFKKGEQR